MLGPSAHFDTFTRDNLTPEEQWPNFLLYGFDYPEYLNAGVELTDVWSKRGLGDHTAPIGNGRALALQSCHHSRTHHRHETQHRRHVGRFVSEEMLEVELFTELWKVRTRL